MLEGNMADRKALGRVKAMIEKMPAVIGVQYRFVEGYHVFTSTDVRGLYVASQDAKKAFESVGPVLSALICRTFEKILGKEPSFEVTPAQSFDELLRMLDDDLAAMPPHLSNRDFVVRQLAA